MSDLTFNKIAGAVLATGLLITGLIQEKIAKPGFKVEVAEETGGGAAAAEVPPDWGTVLKTADVAAGQATFAKCQSCHNADSGGPNGTGPNLWGVVGRPPASHPGFAYSDGMKGFAGKQPVWDYEHIYEFIKSPQAYVNGTKMTFVGLKQPQDRINIIAFLRDHGGTLPIPAPNPAAAAPAAAAPAADAKPDAAKPDAAKPGDKPAADAPKVDAPKADAAKAPAPTK
jgi:cytochrome c